jgi:hypothetical protein
MLTFLALNESFVNKKYVPNIHHTNLYMNPKDLIKYITSFKDYTIITDSEKYMNLYYLIESKKTNVYYLNVHNMIDSDEILETLKNDYNSFDMNDNLWIFFKGHFIGSNEIIEKLNSKFID